MGTSCRAISPSGQGSMASASGAATGQGRREVGADQHALPPEDAECHRQRVPKALAELQVGVGKVGGAISLREGHRLAREARRETERQRGEPERVGRAGRLSSEGRSRDPPRAWGEKAGE